MYARDVADGELTSRSVVAIRLEEEPFKDEASATSSQCPTSNQCPECQERKDRKELRLIALYLLANE